MASLFPNRDLRLRAHWLPSAVCATVAAALVAVLAGLEAMVLPSGNLFVKEPDIAIAVVGLVGSCVWPFAFAAILIYRPFRDLMQVPLLIGTLLAAGATGVLAVRQYMDGAREFAPSGTFVVFLFLWIPVTLVAMGAQAMRALLGSQFSRTKPQREPLAQREEPPSL